MSIGRGARTPRECVEIKGQLVQVKSVISFHHVGPKKQIQVTRLGSFTQLSHLTGPGFVLHLQAIRARKTTQGGESTGNEYIASLRFQHRLVSWVVCFKAQAGDTAHPEENFPSRHKPVGLNPKVA